mmetsp:Transcript_32572/g.56389  ORF Transcript_32572/g.56389 Transcript_32572/m.56389 type:complete len:412 (+) Transcript_32572:5037-6272(+)
MLGMLRSSLSSLMRGMLTGSHRPSDANAQAAIAISKAKSLQDIFKVTSSQELPLSIKAHALRIIPRVLPNSLSSVEIKSSPEYSKLRSGVIKELSNATGKEIKDIVHWIKNFRKLGIDSLTGAEVEKLALQVKKLVAINEFEAVAVDVLFGLSSAGISIPELNDYIIEKLEHYYRVSDCVFLLNSTGLVKDSKNKELLKAMYIKVLKSHFIRFECGHLARILRTTGWHLEDEFAELTRAVADKIIKKTLMNLHLLSARELLWLLRAFFNDSRNDLAFVDGIVDKIYKNFKVDESQFTRKYCIDYIQIICRISKGRHYAIEWELIEPAVSKAVLPSDDFALNYEDFKMIMICLDHYKHAAPEDKLNSLVKELKTQVSVDDWNLCSDEFDNLKMSESDLESSEDIVEAIEDTV